MKGLLAVGIVGGLTGAGLVVTVVVGLFIVWHRIETGRWGE